MSEQALAAAAAARTPSYRENYLIMCGHLADDLCQGALPAVLAFMYQQGRLESYQDVAILILTTTVINAAAQPLTGWLADRRPLPQLMCLGMCIAALGVMFLGLTESYAVMLLLAAINGAGVATFHPAGGKLANCFAGQRVGKGMSIFSVGGNIGFALGPLYFAACYALCGLAATLLLAVPAALMAIVFIRRNRFYAVHLSRHMRRTRRRAARAGVRENYRGTFILLLVIFSRSACMFGLTAFLPLYFMHVLEQPDEFSAISLTIMGLGGALATFYGGPLADRLGFTQFLRLTSLCVIPCGALFLAADQAYFALLALIPFGIFYYAAMSTVVVIGQKMLPLHVGMATGLTIGLGISFGGLIAPLIGAIGDSYGLQASMQFIMALSVLTFILSLGVPRVDRST